MPTASKLRSTVQGDGEDAQCHRCESSHRRCSVCIKHREVRLQAGDWFYRQLQDRFCRNKNNNNNNLSDTGIENGVAMDPDSTQVREFIERLVESLVSGSLDDVKVNRLYSHPEYDRMFACHHSALCETLVRLSFALQMSIANKPVPEQDSPSAVHTTLKQRVHDIVEEAMTLPNLKTEASSQNKWDEDITSMSYEDILATAILNKVIERFQQRTGLVLRDDNSNVMEPPSKYISSIEIGVTGPSSLDDGETSSHSWSESSHTEPSSMMIEERIEEEVTTYNSDGEAGEETRPASELDFYLSGLNFIKPHRVPFPELGVDIVDDGEDDNAECGSPQPTDLVSPVDSWEENWLFQRRRLKMGGSTQQNPTPVPMLVPNPSEEYRALIGDRDAEEVSDLSDCSDGALEDVVSGMSQQAEEDTDAIVPALDTELVKAPSVESLSQQDSEYTEDYAAVAQRQPVPTPRSSVPQPREEETQEVSEDAMLATPPRPGTIAEREHRKWQSAVPLPNNPYSPENISKRLSKKSELFSYSTAPKSLPDVMLTITPTPLPTSPEPDYNKYGRDYYINESKKSSGSRHSSPQKSSDAAETEHDSGVDTNDTSQPYNLVENEVARWQKGIEQTERQWLSKLATKQTSPINSTSRTSSTNSLAHPDGPANAASIPAKKPTPRQREDAARDWSECSTVSSDLDQDADVPIALPSVKELAKHFSAGVTSDSDTSVSKVAPLTRQKVDVQKSMAEVPTTALKREIHSLTARSISREFREGLRRNLHSKQDSVSSSPELDDKKQTAVVHDTTPGYTSDESGTRSPTPPFGGRRRLQNNIAFWEQMSGK